MFAGLRLVGVLCILAAFNVNFTFALCKADWGGSNVLSLKNSQYEIRYSGTQLRMLALMPSGRPYEEEFAEYELFSYQMINQSSPIGARNLTAETLLAQQPCSGRVDSDLRRDPSVPSRVVKVDYVTANYTIDDLGSLLSIKVEIFNDSLTYLLPDNINATVSSQDIKFSFSMSIKSYPTRSEYFYTKQHLKMYSPYVSIAQITYFPEEYLDRQRPITKVSSTNIRLSNLNVTAAIQMFIFVDDVVSLANTWTPLQTGVVLRGDGYFVLFTGEEAPISAGPGSNTSGSLAANESHIVPIAVSVSVFVVLIVAVVVAVVLLRQRNQREKRQMEAVVNRLNSVSEKDNKAGQSHAAPAQLSSKPSWVSATAKPS